MLFRSHTVTNTQGLNFNNFHAFSGFNFFQPHISMPLFDMNFSSFYPSLNMDFMAGSIFKNANSFNFKTSLPTFKGSQTRPIQATTVKTSRKNNNYIKKLDPQMQELVKELLKRCHERGLDFEIYSGYRSIEKQRKLYAQRSHEHSVAKPGKSMHNYGKAIDIRATKGTEEQIGQIAKELGMRWGGDFKGFREPWHIDMKGWKPSHNNLLASR